ncbi:MAG: hypothetical protein MI802_24395, partial [Desulfobacterales bacterium]|nr:hypothetical protein [Desulfobacterales bacterium]
MGGVATGKFDLSAFSFQDMTRCGQDIETLCTGAADLEDASQRIARFFFEAFRDSDSGERSCVLSRCFCVKEYGGMLSRCRQAAQDALGMSIPSTTKFLTLMGTAGLEPEWCGWEGSRGHKVIPLADEGFVSGIPMISEMIRQFGLDVAELLSPKAERYTDTERDSFSIFFIENAQGSPYIPAQDDFVIPYGVQSVLGFGSQFPTGNIFVSLLFLRTPISRQ